MVAHPAPIQVAHCLSCLLFSQELDEGVVLVSEELDLGYISETAEEVQDFCARSEEVKVLRSHYPRSSWGRTAKVDLGFGFAHGKRHFLGCLRGEEAEGGKGGKLVFRTELKMFVDGVFLELRDLISELRAEVQELDLALVSR